MTALVRFIEIVDWLNEWIGRFMAWLTLGCVMTCFLVVVLRYGFSIGFPWMQELYVWQHAAVFMIGAGYTLLHGGHVSVDIAYSRFKAKTKAWVDIAGTLLFLLPWMAILAWTSSQFVLSSWSIREPSSQADGMPALYLLKTVIWVFCAVVTLQGLSLVARRVLFLSGQEEYSPGEPGQPHHTPEESV